MADGMLSLAWNNHTSAFCHMLSTLREMDRFTDVTMACEGKFYNVHKLVLASCSDYFLKLFDKTPCKHPVVVLKDIEGKDIEALLSYMYDGVVSVAQSDLPRLIKAAEVLQIKGLAVPDDPPVTPTNRKGTRGRCSSDDRSSPQHKRHKHDEMGTVGGRQKTDSTSFLGDSEQGLNDSHSADSNTSHEDSQVRRQGNSCQSNQGDSASGTPSTKDATDEGDVKDEITIEGTEIEESNFDFGPLTQNVEAVTASKMNDISVTFNPPSTTQSYNTQAGPSGFQPWPSPCENEISNQGYPSNMNLDASTAGQSMQQHQSQDQQYSEDVMLVNDTVLQCHPFSRADRRTQKPSCPFCGHVSRDGYDLKKHMRTHNGEKPYGCHICSFRANDKSALKKHVRNHGMRKSKESSFSWH